MATIGSIVLGCVAGVGLYFILDFYNNTRRRSGSLQLPPGPRPLPILGNLFDLPPEASWLTYTEWAKTYGTPSPDFTRSDYLSSLRIGEIISVRALGQPVIVLNSWRVAKDLLEKRGTIYSDRPSIPFYSM